MSAHLDTKNSRFDLNLIEESFGKGVEVRTDVELRELDENDPLGSTGANGERGLNRSAFESLKHVYPTVQSALNDI
jgi:hypothetical protein